MFAWFDAGGHAHSSSVTSLDCHPDNNLIVTGSTDVTAKVISAQSGKVRSASNKVSIAIIVGIELYLFKCTTGAVRVSGFVTGMLRWSLHDDLIDLLVCRF